MAQAKKIDLLPLAIRNELDRRIVAAAGSGYEEHSAWLILQGYSISKSAIHRYGQGVKTKTFKARDRAQTKVVSNMFDLVAPNPQPAGESTLIIIRDRATGCSCELTSNIPAVVLEQKLREFMELAG